MKEIIKTDKAPSAIGPYSQGVRIGNTYFFSGQLPINVKSNLMPKTIEEQTKQSLENLKGLLESQNMDFSNVVKTTIFLDNIADFGAMNEIYASYFAEPYPARSAFEVGKLPKGALVEIEAIAVK